MKILLLPLIVLSVFLLNPLQAADDSVGSETTFDIEFPGGTFPDLIQQIAELTGERPNMIIGASAQEVNLQPFALKSVTFDQVVAATSVLLTASVNDIRLWADKGNHGIWLIEAFPARESPRPPQPPPAPEFVTRIFQVRPFLEDFNLEDLTTAIETSWEMAGIAEDGRIRYHEETKLLFVRGNREQVALVEQVLLEIRPELDDLREARRAREIMQARIETHLEAARIEIDGAEVWVNELPEGTEWGQAEFWGKQIDSLAAARDRLLEMRASLGDGHPALEDYLETLERWRVYVSGERQRHANSMEMSRRNREQTQTRQQQLSEMAEELRRRRAIRQQLDQEAGQAEAESDEASNP